jgi:hypothetical protein
MEHGAERSVENEVVSTRLPLWALSRGHGKILRGLRGTPTVPNVGYPS